MKYPLDRAAFAEAWLENHRKVYGTANDTDKEFAVALADVLNDAYHTGVEDGRRENKES